MRAVDLADWPGMGNGLAGRSFEQNGSVGVALPSFRRRSHVRIVSGAPSRYKLSTPNAADFSPFADGGIANSTSWRAPNPEAESDPVPNGFHLLWNPGNGVVAEFGVLFAHLPELFVLRGV